MGRFILFSFLIIWIFYADCLGQRRPDTPQALKSSNRLNTVLDKKIDAEIRHAFKRKKLVGIAIDEKSSLNDPINKYLPDSIPSLEFLAVGTLGVILERIYRTRYDSVVVKLICNPLNMSDTMLDAPAGDSSRFAQGYSSDDKAVSAWKWKAFAGAGGLRSTAADMLKYAHANMGDTSSTLNKAILLTHKITFNLSGSGMELGWEVNRTTNHHYVLLHNGQTGGFQSFLIIDPTTQMAVVVLSNKATNDYGAMDDIGEDILELLEKA